jgi:hypothetical protein
MTDELIAELARNPALRVISRTSMVRYKGSTRSLRDIGRELNVDAIVEGSALKSGEQARITLKLVEVATDSTLLAESYTRELQDVLALQSHIARALSERVRAAVTSPGDARLTRRVDPEAYDHYLRGRSAWNTRTPDGVTRALASFRRAIDRDPAYAAAWAGVATATSCSAARCSDFPRRKPTRGAGKPRSRRWPSTRPCPRRTRRWGR